jgi:hypothetical protein
MRAKRKRNRLRAYKPDVELVWVSPNGDARTPDRKTFLRRLQMSIDLHNNDFPAPADAPTPPPTRRPAR